MLLKGVNKRVIVIKNTESEIFEEAYFIVKSAGLKGAGKQSKENEMVIEANRIISDYHNQQRSIIEKNGIASSIGGDLTELDSFLNSGVKSDTNPVSKINSVNVKNIGKTEKDKKDGKQNKSDKSTEAKKTKANRQTEHLPADEICEGENFFGNIHDSTEKYGSLYSESDFNNYGYKDYRKENKPGKSAFKFISSKKVRTKKFPIPPKSFFVGVGFMSAVIILIRLFEMIVLN